METLILKNNSKKDLNLLLTIAKKMGMDLEVSATEKPENSLTKKLIHLRSLAQKTDATVKPNTISITTIVEENNLVRKQMFNEGKHNN
jgi:hypothetical protein